MTQYKVIPTISSRGLFSHFLQVLSALMIYDKEPDTKVLVDFTYGMLYKSASHPLPNVWEYYFEQTADVDLKTAYANGAQVIPMTYNYSIFVDEEKRKLSNDLINKYIRVKPHIVKKVEEFAKNFDGKKLIGVHVRRTDHIQDAPYIPDEYYFAQIDTFSSHMGMDSIFLCTDDESVVNSFTMKYGSRIITYPSIRSVNGKALHFSSEIDGYRKGEDVLIEAMLLAKTNFLLKTVSGVTHFSVCYNMGLEYVDIDKHLERYNQ